MDPGCVRVRTTPGSRSADGRSTRLITERNLGDEAGSASYAALDVEFPSDSRDPIGQAVQSRAAAKIRSADAVVSDFDVELVGRSTSP